MTLHQKSKVSEAAATWNSRFASEDYIFGKEPNRWLSQQSSLLPKSGTALCIADGEGRNSVWLAGTGLHVDAFDVSTIAVEKARRLAAEKNVKVNCFISDCDSFDWKDCAYDAVVAIFIQFADPAERERIFSNMVRALKPGGLIFIQGYTPKQLEFGTGGPAEVSHLYTKELLRTAFSGLEICALDEYEDELSEGKRHLGRSALIGLVARKSTP